LINKTVRRPWAEVPAPTTPTALFAPAILTDILGGSSARAPQPADSLTMNPKHVPATAPNRARCPVCQEAVYSRAGIHPQCAMKQSEPPRPKPAPPKPPAAPPVRAPKINPKGVVV
jgi:hypothetical protein